MIPELRWKCIIPTSDIIRDVFPDITGKEMQVYSEKIGKTWEVFTVILGNTSWTYTVFHLVSWRIIKKYRILLTNTTISSVPRWKLTPSGHKVSPRSRRIQNWNHGSLMKILSRKWAVKETKLQVSDYRRNLEVVIVSGAVAVCHGNGFLETS